MVHHTGVETASPTPERRAGRKAGSIAAVAVVKTNSLLGDTIQVRTGVPVVSIAPQMVSTKRIDVNV
jgi:hypothetical protein